MNLTIGENKIIFYDSIKNLPNARKILADNYLLWLSNVGNDLDTIRGNLVKAIEYIAYDKKQDAITLIQNTDMGLEAIVSEEDFELKELCCYLKSINEEQLPISISGNDIDDFAEKLNQFGVSISQVQESLIALKKK